MMATRRQTGPQQVVSVWRTWVFVAGGIITTAGAFAAWAGVLSAFGVQSKTQAASDHVDILADIAREKAAHDKVHTAVMQQLEQRRTECEARHAEASKQISENQKEIDRKLWEILREVRKR